MKKSKEAVQKLNAIIEASQKLGALLQDYATDESLGLCDVDRETAKTLVVWAEDIWDAAMDEQLSGLEG